MGHIVDKYMLEAKVLTKTEQEALAETYRGVLRGCDGFKVNKCQQLLREVCGIKGCDLSCTLLCQSAGSICEFISNKRDKDQ